MKWQSQPNLFAVILVSLAIGLALVTIEGSGAVSANAGSHTEFSAPPGALAAPFAPGALISPTNTLVSRAWDGSQGNGHSPAEFVDAGRRTAISGDGRYVAFMSEATNLVQNDANNRSDVFVHDRQTGQTALASVASDGTQANEGPFSVAISGSGRYVAFTSFASNLIPGDPDTLEHLYIRDLSTGQTSCVPRPGYPSTPCAQVSDESLSADGRYIAFVGRQVLTPPYGPGTLDVYVYDQHGGAITKISVTPDGSQSGSWDSMQPAVSADGRFVAFRSAANNLVPGDTNAQWDIFVHDRLARRTTRVSVHSDGTQANGESSDPTLSADGRYVAFASEATNLVDGDTNGKMDIFVHDRQTGQTTRVSVRSDGTQLDGSYTHAAISADGRYVVFYYWGDYVFPGVSNGIFVHDRATGQTLLASVAYNGQPASGNWPVISADGRYVVFGAGDYWNLVENDTNGYHDIFLRDRGGSIVLVQDEANTPVPGAQVYRNHYLAGITGADGTLVVPDLQAGDRLIARYLVGQAAAGKGHHDQDAAQNWAYRVYITSMDIPTAGEPVPFIVANPSVDQVLTVKKTNTLIGFNLLVSVEWDADAAYLSQLRQGFELASAYLYDATDGQMLLERISILDNGQYWPDADYLVHASNQEWPRAHVAVILSRRKNKYTFLGRDFQGPWTSPDGYRTLIHEFGHYGLGLYDSYYYTQTVSGKTVEQKSDCTSAAIRNNTTPDINATLMDYQYNATELAMQGVSGLWSPQCLNTFQWQMHEKSDWETLANYYTDQASPMRWWMKTPATHGGVVAGPAAIPVNAWTQAQVSNDTRMPICSVAPVILARHYGVTVIPTATVTLHRSGTGQIIEQGKTDAWGFLTILGAGPGDRIHVSGDITLAGTNVTVEGWERIDCATTLQGRSVNEEYEVILTPDPFNLALSAWPGSGADEMNIEVAASVSLSGTPQLALHQTGLVTPTAVALHYDAVRDVYTATAILTTSLSARGILAARAVNTQTQSVEAFLPFDVTTVAHDQHSILWSSDGVAELYLPPGALAADGRVSIVAEQLLKPLPEGLLLISGPYAIRAAEEVIFNGGGNLKLRYPARGDWENRVRLFGASLYRWDGAAWQAPDSNFDVDHQYASAPVDDWGTYALMTRSAPIFPVYLPLVRKG